MCSCKTAIKLRRHLLVPALLAPVLVTAWACLASPPDERSSRRYDLGRPATPAEIAAWDIDVPPSGAGLPPGRGTVQQGRQIFLQKCAACHGQTGQEGSAPPLVGGRGSLAGASPMKTIGSYWPYATTVYDYIHRAMPPTAPQSLTPEEIYSLVAWLLYRNEIVAEDAVMDAETLPRVRMPNRNGFLPDPRPDVSSP